MTEMMNKYGYKCVMQPENQIRFEKQNKSERSCFTGTLRLHFSSHSHEQMIETKVTPCFRGFYSLSTTFITDFDQVIVAAIIMDGFLTNIFWYNGIFSP